MKFYDNHCYRYYADRLTRKFRERDEYISNLLNKGETEKLLSYVEEKRAFLKSKLSFPIKTNVTSSIVSSSDCLFFRIENVYLSLLPTYFVPINVYVPKGTGPFPAVVVTTGHWPEGKNMAENQLLCKNLAANGILAAAYDPIMQGERNPFDEDFIRDYFSHDTSDMQMVNLHMQCGTLSYLMGHDLGELFVLDGKLVIDYLVGRSDVDASKIGITGQSGGGTQASYLAAIDDRITCYSPIQSTTRTILTIKDSGIGDCEQSIYGSCSMFGFDCADVLWAAFPKPCMINSSDGDFFSVSGAHDIADEVSKLYSLLDDKDNFSLKVTHGKHWLNKEARLLEYGFFMKQFYHHEKVVKEIDFERVLPENLLCITENRKSWPHALLREELCRCKKNKPQNPDEIRRKINNLIDSNRILEPITALYLPTKEKSDDLKIFIVNPKYLTHYMRNNNCDSLYIQPFLYDDAFRKDKSRYDVVTGVFNEAVINGNGMASSIAGQIIECIRSYTNVTKYNEIHLIVEHPYETVALMIGAVLPIINKTCLVNAMIDLEHLFSQEFHDINEVCLEPSLLQIADLPDLAALNKNVVAINPMLSGEPFVNSDECPFSFIETGEPWEVV